MAGPGYRYSPPGQLPSPTTPGTPLPAPGAPVLPYTRPSRGVKEAVGLKSVHQLSLYAQISDIRDMTELYNLLRIDNPNDHNLILGTE